MATERRAAPPMVVGSRIDFVATFLGRRLAYTYEVVELRPGERLVMRTAQGPFVAVAVRRANRADLGRLVERS